MAALSSVMMVLTFLTFAVASFFLLRKAKRGWIAVLVPLALGTFIFISDVDFSQPLGLQF